MAMPMSQAPGDGYIYEPSSREIKTLYWELYQTTEIWVRLSPDGVDRNKPAPVSLIFYVTFPGKELANEPTDITIRAQSSPLFVTTKFSLKLMPRPGEPLDLAGPLGPDKNSIGTNFQYLQNCRDSSSSNCTVNGIISYLPWKVFMQIASSETLTAEVLGIEVSFQQADLDALRAFARRLVPEVQSYRK
jgi:hypothetical protein